MTGRTNINKVSEKSVSPIHPNEHKKQTRSKTNQSSSYEQLSKDGENRSLHQSLGLKDVIDSARRSFEKGFKGNTSNRKRYRSGSTNLSSRVSTRASSGNISTISPKIGVRKSLSPTTKSPKKSSSAPASPTKPCKLVEDINLPKHSFTKRMKLDQSKSYTTKTRISRSELLLKSAANILEDDGLSKRRDRVSPTSEDSEVIVNLPTSPIYRERKASTKTSDPSNYNLGNSVYTKDQSNPAHTEKRISLCSVLDSTIDASFESNDLSMNESSNTNCGISPKAKNQFNQVAKSPNRMLLSDSKRGASDNFAKNKPVSMNEVIKLHQDEGVLHLLHGLPSSRRIRSVGAVSATVVRRRPSNENTQDSLMRQSQGKKSTSDSINIKGSSDSPIPGLVRKSIAAGYGPKQQRPPPRQHSPNVNSLFCPISNIKPCSKEDLMTSDNLELLKQLPSKIYMKLLTSPSRYILKDNDLYNSSKCHLSKISDSSQAQSNVTSHADDASKQLGK